VIGGRIVREYRQVTLLGLLLTVVLWLVLVFVVGGLLVAAWPLVIAAGCGFVVAWWRGWHARRLVIGALWCLPMLATFVIAYGIDGGAWQVAAWSPVLAWDRSWHALTSGDWLRAMVLMAPSAVPFGMLLAALAWRARVALMAAGAVGWWPGAPVAFDERQWRRQVRTAALRVRAPGGVPLTRRDGPVLGATIRAVGHRPRPVLRLPYGAVRSHLLVIGTTGAGKTTTMVRLWAGFWACAAELYRKLRGPRPWLMVIDAKGGWDARDAAQRAREVLADVGAQTIAVWPDEVALDMWALPPLRLAELLIDLVPVAEEGAAAYYADVLTSIVGLAVAAPCGPPRNSADFLARLDAAWLADAYAGDRPMLAEASAARDHCGEARLRYRALFSRLGPGFDGDAAVTDFDVLYCIVEGTASHAVGEAQALLLTELAAHAATGWGIPGAERRAGTLALDEFSAVARRVPIHALTERCRSLGLAVQVAAQSWAALAPGEDERARLAATAAGGVVVMRCPDPDALCRLAGTRAVIETGRKIIGQGRYGQEGTGRVQRAWVVDPDRVRNFRAGQAAYISGAACTYVQVAPHRRSPLALPTPPVAGLLPGSIPGPQEPPTRPERAEQAPVTGPELPLPGGRGAV
jgi:Helicase HerA, central domain